MGKAAMCIRMLEILSTGRTFKKAELAERMETNPRNIEEYVKELEEVGYYIKSTPGRYGGYSLENDCVIPVLKMTGEEKEALVESYDYVMNKKDFLKKTAYTNAMGKVMANINIPDKANDMVVSDFYRLSMNEPEIRARYLFIEDSINTKYQVEMTYASLKEGERTIVVDPYKLFIYNNAWFFLAWSHDAGDVRSYKLNRIKEFKKLDKKFAVWREFRVENYIDANGFKKNGEYYEAELIVSGSAAALMKERNFGRNQRVEDLGNGNAKVYVELQNNDFTLQYIFRWGTNCQVIKPDWLKTTVQENAKKILEMYQED